MKTVTQMPATEQLELPIADMVHPEYAPDLTIQQRFEEFDAANRWVYFSIVMLTEDWLRRGNKRISMDMLVHILRWQYGRETTSTRFRVNNDFTSRFARKVIAEHPQWDGVFALRGLKTP